MSAATQMAVFQHQERCQRYKHWHIDLKHSQPRLDPGSMCLHGLEFCRGNIRYWAKILSASDAPVDAVVKENLTAPLGKFTCNTHWHHIQREVWLSLALIRLHQQNQVLSTNKTRFTHWFCELSLWKGFGCIFLTHFSVKGDR